MKGSLCTTALFGCIFYLTAACTHSNNLPVINREIALNNDFFKGKAAIHDLSNERGFKISLTDSSGTQTDRIIFSYPYYRFDSADVNHDGRTEILIGLIKKTEFDPTPKKRMFILRIDDGQLRPLWLGSKVCQELIDFKTQPNGIIQTLEKTKTGKYAVGHYTWQSFGLTLLQYTYTEQPYDYAYSRFIH